MLTLLILAMSLLVRDAQGYSPRKPIARDGAEGIAEACERVPGSATCAAILITIAFRESGYDLRSRDPSGWTCGPFQTLASLGCPDTWREAANRALDLVIASGRKCPRDPLAYYASGSCTNAAGIGISRARLAESRRILYDATTTGTPRPR